MKRSFVVILALLIPSLAVLAGTEKFLLVRLSDRARKTTYQVMTEEEYKKLVDDIKQETRVYGKVLAIAQNEWRKNKDNTRSFPRSAVSVPKAAIVASLDSADKAEEKQLAYEQKDVAKEEQETEKERLKNVRLGKSDEAIARDDRKDRERELLFDSARTLYEEKLKEFLSPPAPQPAEPKKE